MADQLFKMAATIIGSNTLSSDSLPGYSLLKLQAFNEIGYKMKKSN